MSSGHEFELFRDSTCYCVIEDLNPLKRSVNNVD